MSTVSTAPEGFGEWAMQAMRSMPIGGTICPIDRGAATRSETRKRSHHRRELAKLRAARAKEVNAMKRARRLKRNVTWADRKAIAAFYAEASRLTKCTGALHEVDHVIPLQGRMVSGLHVETNLRVIPHDENRRKYNHFDAD